MARQRMISPKFFADEDLAGVSFPARLLALAILTQADREGRLEDRPRLVKVGSFPHDNVDVAPLLDELVGVRFLVRYVVDGRAYLMVRSFHRYQKPHPNEARSSLPAPPSSVLPWTHVTRTSDIGGSAQAESESESGDGYTPPAPLGGGLPPDDIADGRILVHAQLLANEYQAQGGIADRYWRRRTKQALRDRGLERGAEFIRGQMTREREAREAQDAEAAAAQRTLGLMRQARAAGLDGHGEWAAIAERLEARLDPLRMGTWIRPLRALGIVRDQGVDRLLVGAPNQACMDWLVTNYREALAEAAKGAGLELAVVIVVDPMEQRA